MPYRSCAVCLLAHGTNESNTRLCFPRAFGTELITALTTARSVWHMAPERWPGPAAPRATAAACRPIITPSLFVKVASGCGPDTSAPVYRALPSMHPCSREGRLARCGASPLHAAAGHMGLHLACPAFVVASARQQLTPTRVAFKVLQPRARLVSMTRRSHARSENQLHSSAPQTARLTPLIATLGRSWPKARRSGGPVLLLSLYQCKSLAIMAHSLPEPRRRRRT